MTLENKISQRSFETINGWCAWEKALKIYELILETDSKITVELGCYAARSLLPAAFAHKEKQSGFILGFDAYKNSVCLEGTNSDGNNEFWKNQDLKKIYREALDLIDRYSLNDFASIVKMRSQDAGKVIADNCIDMLHQDSNHNVETIIAELELWTPKIKTGGLWIADDVQWVEAKEGYARIPEFGFEMIQDHFEWVVYKKIK